MYSIFIYILFQSITLDKDSEKIYNFSYFSKIFITFDNHFEQSLFLTRKTDSNNGIIETEYRKERHRIFE